MNKKHSINTIQALRGVAALMVVVLHSYVYLDARDIISGVPSIVNAGRAGVDIFFVISGFIMVYISGDKFNQAGASKIFIVKRIIRVVPIYWFYTLIMAGFLFYFPHLFSDGKMFRIEHLFASLSFIPWDNGIGRIKPILPVGWTLNYEMYFYALFAFVLFFPKRRFVSLLTILLFSGIFSGYIFNVTAPIYSVITSPLLIEFLMGCAICILYKKNIDFPNYFLFSIMLFGVLLLLLSGIIDYGDTHRVIKWGFPAALIVFSCVFLERKEAVASHSLLNNMGTSSYSLYLSHTFIINAVGKVWSIMFGSMYELFIFISIVTSVVVGYIAYLVLEKPITDHLNRKYSNYLNIKQYSK